MQTGPKQAGLHCSPGQHLSVAERPKHGIPAGMQIPVFALLLVTSLPLLSIPIDKASGVLSSSPLEVASIEVIKAKIIGSFCMIGCCVQGKFLFWKYTFDIYFYLLFISKRAFTWNYRMLDWSGDDNYRMITSMNHDSFYMPGFLIACLVVCNLSCGTLCNGDSYDHDNYF